MRGVNASVVGILAAALYDPAGASALDGIRDVAIAAGGFALLSLWRMPARVVVIAVNSLHGRATILVFATPGETTP